MPQQANTAKGRWTERVGLPRAPLTASIFPDDAVAVIYRPTRSAMTSGAARTRCWKLRFEPRAAPYLEPLMGWTGCDDTLTQVELTFPTLEAAAAYARHHGLRFVVRGDSTSSGLRLVARSSGTASSDGILARPRLEWVERILLEGAMLKDANSGRNAAAAISANAEARAA